MNRDAFYKKSAIYDLLLTSIVLKLALDDQVYSQINYKLKRGYFYP